MQVHTGPLTAGWWALAVATSASVACGPPPRDADFPQYMRPRPETLAWRRLTSRPSPELEVTPPPRVESTTPLPSATEPNAPPPSQAIAARCHAVPGARSCNRAPAKAFACGVYDGTATREPPVEMVFLAATPIEAESLAAAADERGARPLPARACRIVAFDACGPSVDVACTDDHGRATAITRVAL